MSSLSAGTEDRTGSLADLSSAPSAGQIVRHNDKELLTVKEGLAYILIPRPTTKPESDLEEAATPQAVFYNPIQQFNRDLSVLAIKTFGEECLSARRGRLAARSQHVHGDAETGRKRGKKRKRGISERGKLVPDEPQTGEDLDKSGEAATSKALAPSKGEEADQDSAAPNVPEANTGDSIDKLAEDAVIQVKANGSGDSPFESGQEGPSQQNGAREPGATKSPQPKFRILDALSATGLRALRYAHEIPFVTAVTANDLMPEATQSIRTNVKHNRLDDKIHVSTGNALAHMYSLVGQPTGKPRDGLGGSKYDVIDLDPYGTAAPFLDAAIQSLNQGGLLCVTCTDTGIFASTGYPEKCYALYGGVPVKGPHCHEAGLRLILHCIATSAARHGLVIEPLLSLSIDYYVRVFVRLRHSPAEVKCLAGKTMLVYGCDQGCGAWTTQKLARHTEVKGKKGAMYYRHGLAQGPSAPERCQHCGYKTHVAGPMYGGPIHSPGFIQRMLDGLAAMDAETYGTKDRMEGMLLTARNEKLGISSSQENRFDAAKVDPHPFFFIPHNLAKVIHCETPNENAMRGALRHLGYGVSRSHCKPGSIKTDAPWTIIWEVMRQWAKQKKPIREGAIKAGTAGWGIMNGGGSSDVGKGTSVVCEPAKEDDAAADAGSPLGEEVITGAVDPSRSAADQRPKGVKVVFDEKLGMAKDGKRVLRYQVNPTANWGPMVRAKGSG
ncbi:MAG: RNA methyltransferase tRNA(m5U54)methyltransferase [Caeruleum heppii]|nr:MAG: RNA methyltransferase tRNA(m5U54)methyltransferase [Caeruleum heppii]